jgi:hypothetical protein
MIRIVRIGLRVECRSYRKISSHPDFQIRTLNIDARY